MFTTLTDDYLPGFIVFMRSFLHYNEWFDLDFVILDMGLSENTKKMCRLYYDKIIFIEPQYENYRDINYSNTPRHLQNTYYKLEMFSIAYDTVVSVDMDMVVGGSIQEAFEEYTEKGIYACQCYDWENDNLSKEINSGFLVLNKPKRFYNDIVDFCKQGFRLPDQDCINKFFKEIEYLDKKYNCEKWMFKGELIYSFEPVIIHYVAENPWQYPRKEKQDEKRKKFLDYIEEEWFSWL